MTKKPTYKDKECPSLSRPDTHKIKTQLFSVVLLHQISCEAQTLRQQRGKFMKWVSIDTINTSVNYVKNERGKQYILNFS